MSRVLADRGYGSDRVMVLNDTRIVDSMTHHTVWKIDKFYDQDGTIEKLSRKGLDIQKIIELYPNLYIGSSIFEGNVCLNEGIQAFEDLLAGLSSPTPWNNANARVGVGESSVSESATHTGLQGASKVFKGMDTGFPSRSNQTVTWRGTFGGAEANQAWNEFTVVNASSDTGTNLNRKVSAQGTKTSGQTWILSVSITWS